jgi:MFS transporter, ACS family, D-galactonate transporter
LLAAALAQPRSDAAIKARVNAGRAAELQFANTRAAAAGHLIRCNYISRHARFVKHWCSISLPHRLPQACGGEGVALTDRPSRTRFVILALLFISVVINYLDRANLSIAAPLLAKDLAIDSVRMGLVFSAFGWSYVFCQIPGGWLVDRMHPRKLYAALIALWSVATALLGLSAGLAMLFALRLAIGAMEAPSYPINNRVVTTWFPENERATAIGLYTSGQFVGVAFLTPALMYLQVHFGWRSIFVAVGLAGIVWAAVWYMVYRGPLGYRGANPAEIELIRRGGGLVELSDQQMAAARASFDPVDLGTVLSRRKLWGIYIGQYALNSTLWFFLTWFPTYLVKYRGIGFQQAGWLASLPFLGAFCGVLCSGLLSDLLVRRGLSLTVARKTPIVTGLLLSTTIIGANYAHTPNRIIAFMGLAFFGNGLASITWSLISSVAPKRLIGLTGGVFNFIGNMASITVPLIIGALVRGGDFSLALVYISGLALIGALSYVLVVGRIERLPDRPQP